MDQSNLPNSDPTILLLNEIEILGAQTRLMELYLKQAQATAANNANRSEQQHQAELAALRAVLAEKEQTLSQLEASVVNDRQLSERVREIEAELADRQRIIDDRQADLTAAKNDIATLRDRISELESARQRAQTAAATSDEQSKQLQDELNGLRQELETNRRDFDDQLLSSRQAETSLREQLQQLQSQLTEKQLWSENADSELAAAQSEIFALQQRIDELHASRRQLETDAAGELEKSRAHFEAEIAELQTTLSTQTQERQQSQAAIGEIEGRLKSEIGELHDQLEKKRSELTARDNDWKQARSEIVVLQQQVVDLQAKAAQAESRNAEFATLRQTFENEIAELEHEVGVKERELIQRYEAVSAVELALHSRIQVLQQELGHSRQELSIGQSELESQRGEIIALKDKIADLENARAETESAGKRFVDETRQCVEDELKRLHANLAQKDYSLKEQENAHRNLAEQFNTEILQLRQQLDQEQTRLQSTNAQFVGLREELAAQQERNGELDKARQEALDNWQRAGVIQSELQSRLQAKNDDLDAAHANAIELRAQLETKLTELDGELAQRQSVIDSRGGEIAELTNRSQHLLGQIGELESKQRETAQRIEESEQSRAAHQAELADLDVTHEQKFSALERELMPARERVIELENHIQEIATRHRQLATDFQARHQHMEAAVAENAVLNDRLLELAGQRDDQRLQVQGLERARVALEGELAARHQELQQKNWSMAQQQAVVENLALAHKEQLQKLEARLTEQQSHGSVREAELAQLRNQESSLQRRVEELQSELHDAEVTERNRIEQIRQENLARVDELNALVNQKDSQIAERSATQVNLEQTLRREVERLLHEIDERNGILQNRNDELVRVKADFDSTNERLRQLEATAAQAQTNASSEVESMRTEYQAQLALLQAELSQKQWVLDERQASASGAEQEFRQQIASLRQQLSEKESAEHQLQRDFVMGDKPLTHSQHEASTTAKPSSASNGIHVQPTSADSRDRRWHSMFGGKRRWKN